MTTTTAAMRTTLTLSSSFSSFWSSLSSSPSSSSSFSLSPSLSMVDRESSLTPPRRSLPSASQRSLCTFFRVFYRRLPFVFCILFFEKSDVWATESHHIPSHSLLSLSPCILCDCANACVDLCVCLYQNHSKGEHWRFTNPEAKKHFFLLDFFRGYSFSASPMVSTFISSLGIERGNCRLAVYVLRVILSLFLLFSSLCFFVVSVSASAMSFRGGFCVRDIHNEMT